MFIKDGTKRWCVQWHISKSGGLVPFTSHGLPPSPEWLEFQQLFWWNSRNLVQLTLLFCADVLFLTVLAYFAFGLAGLESDYVKVSSHLLHVLSYFYKVLTCLMTQPWPGHPPFLPAWMKYSDLSVTEVLLWEGLPRPAEERRRGAMWPPSSLLETS